MGFPYNYLEIPPDFSLTIEISNQNVGVQKSIAGTHVLLGAIYQKMGKSTLKCW